MTPLTAVLVYAGIPIALAIILWALLSAKAWKSGSDEAADDKGGPFLVTTGAAKPDPSRLPRELDSRSSILAGGGASGRW